MVATRAALVIGASEFADPKFQRLRSPSQDVSALAGVLGDDTIGGFEVRSVVNQPNSVVQQQLERFFSGRKPDDLLFLYFSCHGVKDATGRLYFVTSNTTFDLLRSTGVSASFVSEQMEYSRAKRIVVLLDCCYSGAFLKGFRARGGDIVAVEELEGRGRAVITASRATEYAFEAEELTADNARPSMFTGAVVEGLATGGADANGDGFVTVDELYDYVYDAVRDKVAGQTPGRWIDVEGDLVVARNPRPLVRAAALPAELERAIGSDLALQRLGAVAQLAEWRRAGDAEQRAAAGPWLERLTRDYDERVQAAAATALDLTSEPAPAPATAFPLTAPAKPGAAEVPGAASPEAREGDGPADRIEHVAAWLAAAGALAVLLAPYFAYLRYDDYSEKLGERDFYTLGAFVLSAIAAVAAYSILRTRWRATGCAMLVALLPLVLAEAISWLGETSEATDAIGLGAGWVLHGLGHVLLAAAGTLAIVRFRHDVALAPPRLGLGRRLAATILTAAALIVGWLGIYGSAMESGLNDGTEAIEPVYEMAFWLFVLAACACISARWVQGRNIGSAKVVTAAAVAIAFVVIRFLTTVELRGGRHMLVDTSVAVLAIGAIVVPPLATVVAPRRLGLALLATWAGTQAAWLPTAFAQDTSADQLFIALAAAAALTVALHVMARREATRAV